MGIDSRMRTVRASPSCCSVMSKAAPSSRTGRAVRVLEHAPARGEPAHDLPSGQHDPVLDVEAAGTSTARGARSRRGRGPVVRVDAVAEVVDRRGRAPPARLAGQLQEVGVPGHASARHVPVVGPMRAAAMASSPSRRPARVTAAVGVVTPSGVPRPRGRPARASGRGPASGDRVGRRVAVRRGVRTFEHLAPSADRTRRPPAVRGRCRAADGGGSGVRSGQGSRDARRLA